MSSIRAKLFIGLSSIIVVFLLSVLVTLYFIRVAAYDTNRLQSSYIPLQDSLVNLQSELSEMQYYMNVYVFLKDAGMKSKIDKQLFELGKNYQATVTAMQSVTDNQLKDKWGSLSNYMQEYLADVKLVLADMDSGLPDKAIETYKAELVPILHKLHSSFNATVSENNYSTGILSEVSKKINEDVADINQQMSFIFISTFIFLVASLLLSYIITTMTSRSILKPLMYAVAIAEDIASGKRDMKINTTGKDETALLLISLSRMFESIKESEYKINEIANDNKRLYDAVVKAANLFGKHATNVAAGELSGRIDIENEGISQEVMQRLGKELNNMTDNLADVTSEIMLACSSMVTTLDEVRHAVDAQSSGASEQASSINQITASIAEIERSASQTMNKAQDLGSVAEKTRQSGQLGLESIESSVVGMKVVRDRVQLIAQTILDLSRQTQQVGEITAVVNNLAQQSKMLALNASIEAAKAGDAGKGFAVVAAEVKNLAEQSEQSTSQVQKILEDIRVATEKAVMVTEEGTKGVDNGLSMIEKTGEVIRDLNDVIREASMVSQQIEAAVRQETAGIEQITAGMNEINTVTASFVESVGQTTEAMDNLANLSNKLKSRVETYKL